MPENKLHSLEKIGYSKSLPKEADINNFESIEVTKKSGEKIRLYRLISDTNEIDDTNNFSSSWDVFNSYL